MNLGSEIKRRYYNDVWAVVQQIPLGNVATYGQIAKLISLPVGISAEDYQIYASRWVGLAMAASPDDVPWQRVVNSQGKISSRPEAGVQKQLLEDEGILFFNEKLDLKEYQWQREGAGDKPRQESLF